MTGTPQGEDARASLELIDDARRALVRASIRPVWIDAGFALIAGVSLALIVRHTDATSIIGLALLVVGTVAYVLAERASTRRRGLIVDDRSVGAGALWFVGIYLLVAVALLVPVPAEWEPWSSLVVGLIVAPATFWYLRTEVRYQSRRLARGDFGRYDLL